MSKIKNYYHDEIEDLLRSQINTYAFYDEPTDDRIIESEKKTPANASQQQYQILTDRGWKFCNRSTYYAHRKQGKNVRIMNLTTPSK